MNGLAFLLTASALTAAGPTPDLGFLPNVGQAPPQVAFIAPTPGGAVWVGDDGALSIGPVTQRVVGGPLDPRAGDLGPTRVSLSLPGALAADIPTYSTVLLGEPHPGLRAQVSLRGGRPELIFILAPGARSDGIRVAVEGQIDLAVNARGELVIATVEGPLVLAPPTVWQDGEARAARYTVRDGEYGVSVPEYDHSRPLLIDPLYKAAYLGGAGDDRLVALLIPSDPAHPHRGKPHLVARTTSMDLVDPSGAVSAHTDVLVARMSTDLKTVEQAHILGGSGDDDVFTAAFHPASQQLILAGVTESTDLVPASMAAPQPQPGGYDDGFVAALSPDLGTLERVTYLGGAGMERVTGLAMNTMEGDPRFGLIYVCGNTNSDDLPQRFNGAIPVRAGILDAFVTRFAADLSAMHVSTYIGGASGSESYVTVAVSPHDGAVLLKGVTNSWMDDFPVTANAVQPAFGGGAPGTTDLFLARFDANLATLETATYLGGDALEEHGYEPIAFAPFGTDVFLGGTTMSSNFPDVVLGTRGDRDAFVIRMDGALTQIYGGVAVGGSNADLLYEMLLAPGAESEVILVGLTGSPDLPGTEGAPQTTYGGGAGDLFVARLAPGLQEVRRLTYLGGTGREGAAMMALDATRDALVVAGYTDSSGWDALAAGPQPRLSFGLDAFVVRLSRTLDELEGGTYFGGHDDEMTIGLALHPDSGDVYLAGYTGSASLPGADTTGPLSWLGGDDTFIAHFDPGLTGATEPAPDIEVTPSGCQYPATPVGEECSIRCTFAVKNVGDADLALASIELAPPQAFLRKPLPAAECLPPQVLGPDAMCAVQVAYLATHEGAETGVMKVASDDPDEPLLEVGLWGAGVAADTDAGPDAGTVDAGAGGDGEGCGCRTEAGAPGGALVVLVVGLAAHRGRRRHR